MAPPSERRSNMRSGPTPSSFRFAFPIRSSHIGLRGRPSWQRAKKHGKEALARMATETGGATYEVSKHQSIKVIYAEIEDALRNQYSMGYRPERSGTLGSYRKIKLSVKDRNLIVTTRAGYYAR